MKRMTMQCSDCGYEERIDVLTPEETVANNLPPRPPRCRKCHSFNVTLND